MQIFFRKLKEKYLEELMNWRMKPEITKNMYTEPELNLNKQYRWFEMIKQDKNKKYWVIEINEIPIGAIYLYDIDYKNNNCSWGYYIGRDDFKGRGLAKKLEYNIYNYVFEKLKLNKLWCEVLSFNDIVVKIHEKYGSKVEGVLRQQIKKDGKYYDVVRMAILKEEWDKIKNDVEYERATIE